MKPSRFLAPTVALALAATSSLANTVAITEFLNNAEGEDDGREWVEFFNYGTSPVDVNGWTLADQGTDSIAMPNHTIQPGDYMIMVLASGLTPANAKLVFETEWLGGTSDARVFGANGMALGNSDDELFLIDGGSNVRWNLAYGNGENDSATRLTQTDFHGTRTDWGDAAAATPYFINREGDDLTEIGIVGLLGYEHNISPVGGPRDPSDDPSAYESDYLAIKDLDPVFYSNVDNGSWGSPLAGGYQVVPEPATLALLALSGLVALRHRRGD